MNSKTVRCLTWPEVFNAFIRVIPNFYSCKANVEFTIVCFDGIDVIGWFRSKPGIAGMSVQMLLSELKKFQRKMEDYSNSNSNTWGVHCEGKQDQLI